MTVQLRNSWTLTLLLWTFQSATSTLFAAPPSTANGPSTRILTRVFFQDDATKTLKWADVTSQNKISLSEASPIPGFPSLDKERNSLVQMETAGGLLLVGIRDDDNGKFQSGWVLIDTGVEEEEHGDHSHWVYLRNPEIRAFTLDKDQGNPAHLYCYDQIFYLANDKRNGFTSLDPSHISRISSSEQIRDRAVFTPGGGGHITLAVNSRKISYATWIDREGANKGRVDITSLLPERNRQIQNSIMLPHGGIHGAIACRGKVFFAPNDGICWIKSSPDSDITSATIQVNHISLGKEGEAPLRTGSFHSWNNFVGFVAGAGSSAFAGLIDASEDQLSV